ncbi:S-adenosyl-L-methionine-dependent methyltransferase [Glarea lozoyensis ATCC 20868]|uniref:S-adenosyl-L-methionine-dependent methyltransferase n=1 Tax=Glarea lozoyensis (strain ATCC 20868 / MF5171) TaxID=1116229 RepID=S3DCD3_GLAL2|nr:S-adenosyl-L-methionine-dependent methyltransferase [Glarea lozoyensis ATCC 20868]EPE24313.1 S-adenosyl-L-methionine-dependent methyltransferase [Glarea lozoyensis ATCC 20868]
MNFKADEEKMPCVTQTEDELVVSEPATVENRYLLSRGYSSNIRVNTQHYLWKEGLYLLHPSIPINGENLRVAEIGVGTGIWLSEMARILPGSAQLDGFDVSHAQCPPSKFLPSNVSLYIHNCLEDPPSDLLEQYDIIHIQMFNSVVENNDPEPVVRNMVKMLKPGGYISWSEFDFATWKTISSTGDKPSDSLDRLLWYNATAGNTKPVNFLATHWPLELPEIYARNNLSEIVTERAPFATDVAAYMLDTFLLAAEELSFNVLDHLGGGQGDVARDLIKQVERERRDITIQLDRLIAVGRRSRRKLILHIYPTAFPVFPRCKIPKKKVNINKAAPRRVSKAAVETRTRKLSRKALKVLKNKGYNKVEEPSLNNKDTI